MVMEKGVAYGVGDCLVDKKLTFGNIWVQAITSREIQLRRANLGEGRTCKIKETSFKQSKLNICQSDDNIFMLCPDELISVCA